MTVAPHEEVVEHALFVLGSSLTGYTDPDDEGHCARVVIVGGSIAQGYFDVQVLRSSDTKHDPVVFRIGVSVSPAPRRVGFEAFRYGERD